MRSVGLGLGEKVVKNEWKRLSLPLVVESYDCFILYCIVFLSSSFFPLGLSFFGLLQIFRVYIYTMVGLFVE